MSIFGFDDMIELYSDLDDEKDPNDDGETLEEEPAKPWPNFLEFPQTVLQCIISHSDLRDRLSMSLVCRLLHELEMKTKLKCDLLEIRSRPHTQDGIEGEMITVVYQNMKIEKFTRRWEDWEEVEQFNTTLVVLPFDEMFNEKRRFADIRKLHAKITSMNVWFLVITISRDNNVDQGNIEIALSECDETSEKMLIWISSSIEIEHLKVKLSTSALKDNEEKAREFYMVCLLTFRSWNLHIDSLTQESLNVLKSFRYQNVLHLIKRFPRVSLGFNCIALSGENIRALYEKMNTGNRDVTVFEIPLSLEVLQEFLATFGVRLDTKLSDSSTESSDDHSDIMKNYAIAVRRTNTISEIFTHNDNVCIFTDDNVLISLQISENPESYFLSMKAAKNERNHASIDAELTKDIDVALWEYDGDFKDSEVSPENVRNIYEKMCFCDYGTLFEIPLSFENLQYFLNTFGVRFDRQQCMYCIKNGVEEDSDTESATESSDAESNTSDTWERSVHANNDITRHYTFAKRRFSIISEIFAYRNEKIFLHTSDKIILSFAVSCSESTQLIMKRVPSLKYGRQHIFRDKKCMNKLEVPAWEYEGDNTPIE